MLTYGDTIARIGQELRQGSKVPVRIFHMPVAQVARQDETRLTAPLRLASHRCSTLEAMV